MAWRNKYLVKAREGDRVEKGHPGKTVRYSIQWRDEDGRVKTKGGFRTAKDADSYKLEIERRESLGTLYQDAPESFGAFFAGWRERYRPTVRPSSFKRRMETAKLLEASEIWPLTFDKIRPAMVEDIVMPVAVEHARQAQYLLQTIKMVLRNAAIRGQPVDMNTLRVKPPVYESRRKRFLTKDEVDRLADGSTEPRLLRFTALTGLRFIEVSGLTDTDVTLGDRSIRIHRAITKTDAGVRTIPLLPEARMLLKEQRLARPPGTTVLFPAPRGGRWSYTNFYHRVWCVNEQRGDLDFHDLRHTFASLMIAAGADFKVLQTLMGHESIKVTMDTYGHLYEGAAERAIEALDEFLRRPIDGDTGSAAGADS
jgi:integrase